MTHLIRLFVLCTVSKAVSSDTLLWYDNMDNYDSNWNDHGSRCYQWYSSDLCTSTTYKCCLISVHGSDNPNPGYITTTQTVPPYYDAFYLKYDINIGTNMKQQKDSEAAYAILEYKWESESQYTELESFKGDGHRYHWFGHESNLIYNPNPTSSSNQALTLQFRNNGTSYSYWQEYLVDNVYLYGTKITTNPSSNPTSQPTNSPTVDPTFSGCSYINLDGIGYPINYCYSFESKFPKQAYSIMYDCKFNDKHEYIVTKSTFGNLNCSDSSSDSTDHTIVETYSSDEYQYVCDGTGFIQDCDFIEYKTECNDKITMNAMIKDKCMIFNDTVCMKVNYFKTSDTYSIIIVSCEDDACTKQVIVQEINECVTILYPELTFDPTHDPTSDPIGHPSVDPSVDPSNGPSADPAIDPTLDPTAVPSTHSTANPTSDPTTSASSSRVRGKDDSKLWNIVASLIAVVIVIVLITIGICIWYHKKQKKLERAIDGIKDAINVVDQDEEAKDTLKETLEGN